MNNIITVENVHLSVRIRNSIGHTIEKSILDNISFSLHKEKILGIAGESGSGKTTLAKLLAGILKPSKGSISLNISSEWKNKRTNPIQILFQNNGEILNPLREIGNIIKEAHEIRFGHTEIYLQKTIFRSVQMNENLWNRKGFELSGGEQQRAALARILSVQPEILILDEPFSSQDPESQHNLLKLFKSINEEYKISMICISHNLNILKALCDDLIIMYNGKIVESGNATNILLNPQHPYTKFLLNAEDYKLSYDEIQKERKLLVK